MADDWTVVSIRGVVIDPVTGDPAVLLEDEAESAIIAVSGDPAVTASIIAQLEGFEHDGAQSLLYRFFVRHGVTVVRIELMNDRALDLGACLHYSYQGESYTMEVRPIDALLVAVQTNADIVAHGELIRIGERKSAPRVLDGSDLLILSRHAH